MDTPASDKKRCPACRRDAPATFFSVGKNACNYCAGGAPQLPEWIDAKLAKSVVCECGLSLAATSLSRHRQTVTHKMVIAHLSARDPAFAAEVEAKEMARAEAARAKVQREGENAALRRSSQEERALRAEQERTRVAEQVFTPEEEALRERVRIRRELCRVAAGRPAVEPPKPAVYVCPDCGSAVKNNHDNVKMHRRTKKHLMSLRKPQDAVTPGAQP